jgi:hypothetical protein
MSRALGIADEQPDTAAEAEKLVSHAYGLIEGYVAAVRDSAEEPDSTGSDSDEDHGA